MRTDPSQINTLFTRYSKSAKLFLNGVYHVHMYDPNKKSEPMFKRLSIIIYVI